MTNSFDLLLSLGLKYSLHLSRAFSAQVPYLFVVVVVCVLLTEMGYTGKRSLTWAAMSTEP